MFTLSIILIALLSYLLGAVNFAIIITWAIKKRDIREFGSGNAGTTNVLRTLGKLPAAIVFVLDFLKVVVAVLIATLLVGHSGYSALRVLTAYWSGFFCVLGHIYPVYYGFRGGKGVLCIGAMAFMLQPSRPLIFICAFSVFLLICLISKMVSLGSMLGGLTLPVFTYIFYVPGVAPPTDLISFFNAPEEQRITATIISFVFSLIIIIKHYDNIKRIIKGEEKKLTFFKKK
jgi:glycerol-3-phosphate acyltransferase PlsY